MLQLSTLPPFKENASSRYGKVEVYGAVAVAGRPWCDLHLQRVSKIFRVRLEHINEMVHINHLPPYFVYIAGVLELGGGVMLVAGLFTRMLGLLLAGEMAIAMWKGEQFFQNPLAVDKYELALALGVDAFALATFGAGSISLDGMLFGKGKSLRGAKYKG